MTFAEKRRGRRRLDPAESEAITQAVRASTNILDQAGNADLDRLIEQLKSEPGSTKGH